MSYKITIPEPCRQNWDNMIPDDTGRYCNSCQKSVIDFSDKTDKEIQMFFSKNLNQTVCGRFKNTQIQRIVIDLPQNIFSIQMPLWMRFLVAALLIFGISIFPFETTVAGKIPTLTSFYQGQPIAVKKEKKDIQTKRKKNKKRKIIYSIIPGRISGMVRIEDNPPIIEILDSSSLQKKEYDTGNYATNIVAKHTSLPKKEHPGPTPYVPAEFILPSILIGRRKKE